MKMQKRLTELIRQNFDEDDKEDGDLECSNKEMLKLSILQCFASLTEKLEDARQDFVLSSEACLGLIEVIGESAKLTQI